MIPGIFRVAWARMRLARLSASWETLTASVSLTVLEPQPSLVTAALTLTFSSVLSADPSSQKAVIQLEEIGALIKCADESFDSCQFCSVTCYLVVGFVCFPLKDASYLMLYTSYPALYCYSVSICFATWNVSFFPLFVREPAAMLCKWLSEGNFLHGVAVPFFHVGSGGELRFTM